MIAPTDERFVVKKIVAPNANHEKQIKRLKSTKKKRHSIKLSLKKPGLNELEMAKTKLLSVPVNVCGICFAENDDRPEDEIQWLACRMCGAWVHRNCAILSDGDDDDYTCSYCDSEF